MTGLSPCRSSLSPILLVAVICLFLAACSFEPEEPHLNAGENQWEFGDEYDAEGDAVEETDVDNTDPDPDNQTDPDPDNQTDPDPDNQTDPDPDNQTDPDPDNQTEPDPDNQTEPDPDPVETCDGQEVDTSTSPNHCGGCGNSCDGEFGFCDQGVCACPSGFEACGGDNRCEYVLEEPSHCGECGNECGPGMACQNGECVCRSGFTMCDGECVDTSRNPNHCGGCDSDCGFGKCQDGQCSAGGCDWSHATCEPDDASGLACIPRQGGSNSLYCRVDFGDVCGVVCGGNQLCQALQGCVDYRSARGCDSCPCDDCTDDEECMDDIPSVDGVYCVAAESWW